MIIDWFFFAENGNTIDARLELIQHYEINRKSGYSLTIIRSVNKLIVLKPFLCTRERLTFSRYFTVEPTSERYKIT